MTRRMWIWSGALLLVGGGVLALAIHAFLGWTPPPTSAEEVLTLDQLLGFVVSSVLIAIAALILWTGLRRHRLRRRWRSGATR